MGHHRRVAAQRRYARRACAAGWPLHAGGARRIRREACGSSARSCRRWSRRENPAALLDALTDPGIKHRDADRHGKSLSAQRGRRSRRDASGYRLGPGEPGSAEDRAWLSGRGDWPPASAGTPALHGPVLRQPAGQRRDAARLLVAFAAAARCRARPVRRRRCRFPVQHGRPHRAGDDRRRPRPHHRTRSASTDAWPVMHRAVPRNGWSRIIFRPAARTGSGSASRWSRTSRPFEDMKLRLLNGAHSSIAYLGLLLGHDDGGRSRSPIRLIREFVARPVGGGDPDACRPMPGSSRRATRAS